MNFKVLNFFKKRKRPHEETSQIQIMEEIKDLRKHMRKQNILLGSIKDDIIKAIVADRQPGIEPYCEVADALFYYGAALRASGPVSPEQLESLEIIWDKLEKLMSLVGLQVMRRAGGDFDAKIYEAIENRAAGAAELAVLQILQPGYILNGLILKPARVVVDRKNQNFEG
ncbi:MAG: nucleotide exchange factor GrpE [Deltaproteobacteria bacterium]|nr:nucleotide exchange factor GrpE [Deltaproteobacteria bacterium]